MINLTSLGFEHICRVLDFPTEIVQESSGRIIRVTIS